MAQKQEAQGLLSRRTLRAQLDWEEAGYAGLHRLQKYQTPGSGEHSTEDACNYVLLGIQQSEAAVTLEMSHMVFTKTAKFHIQVLIRELLTFRIFHVGRMTGHLHR